MSDYAGTFAIQHCLPSFCGSIFVQALSSFIMEEKPHIQIPRVKLGSQGLEVSFSFYN
jgi:hypothetical protein